MKLFVEICMVLCMNQFFSQVSGLYSPGWKQNMHPKDWTREMQADLASRTLNSKPGPEQGIDYTNDLLQPAQINAATIPPNSFRKNLSVTFVLKDGHGNAKKQEQVSIQAGKTLPAKLQRVLDSTDGFITVAYRDHKGLLTRIEKIQLPEHLPKETIPAGGLMINRSELPWEPSINPIEVEVAELSNRALNNEYQSIYERPGSSRTRTTPEHYVPRGVTRKPVKYPGGKPQKHATWER